jgi:hypothetical protein
LQPDRRAVLRSFWLSLGRFRTHGAVGSQDRASCRRSGAAVAKMSRLPRRQPSLEAQGR